MTVQTTNHTPTPDRCADRSRSPEWAVTFAGIHILRIDSVHQGDFDGIKGLYHVNAVDEVTQWQGIFSIPKISERFLVPSLEALILSFPFVILGFHSDVTVHSPTSLTHDLDM